MPELFVITGSNGAGKSTVGPSYFPEHLQDVFDGDKLYLEKRTELWKTGLRVQRELNEQVSDFVNLTFNTHVGNAISQSLDFAYEGHFSQDASWEVLRRFKNAGYILPLLFFGLDHVEISSDRVLIRAKEGGHHVDPLTLENNYYGNLRQVNKRYSLFDSLKIVDTSELEHKDLFFLLKGEVVESLNKSSQPMWFVKHLPDLAKLIK